MSVQASSSRTATKSIGAAVIGLLLTFGIFVCVMLTFLLAPLFCLAVAFLTYSVWKPSRGQKHPSPTSTANTTGTTAQPDRAATYGFGAGTS